MATLEKHTDVWHVGGKIMPTSWKGSQCMKNVKYSHNQRAVKQNEVLRLNRVKQINLFNPVSQIVSRSCHKSGVLSDIERQYNSHKNNTHTKRHTHTHNTCTGQAARHTHTHTRARVSGRYNTHTRTHKTHTQDTHTMHTHMQCMCVCTYTCVLCMDNTHR